MTNTNVEIAKNRIPHDLVQHIEQVENRFNSRINPGFNRKIAAFDLDNTLLVGDCGEAVFTQLKIDEQKQPLTITGEMIPLTWEKYREILHTKGKVEAYSRMTDCMAGLPLKTLLEATHKAIHSDLAYLEFEGIQSPVPYPHPIMQALVTYLQSLGYTIYIISASNQYTVQYTAREFFGIPGSQAFGMVPTVKSDPRYGEVLDGGIEGPVTVEEGKVEVYRENIGSNPPLITAGDSKTDIMMLNLVDPHGLIIWVGDDEKMVEKIKQEINFPDLIYFLKR